MGVFENIPYTNFHETNLEWVVAKIKETAARMDTVEQVVAAVKEEVKQFIDDLDIRQAVNDYIDQLAANGTIKSMLADLMTDFETDYSNRLSALESRVDTFTNLPQGSTTGDAELADGRIAADGIAYPTIGDAIRAQVNNLDDDYVLVENETRTPGASFTYYNCVLDFSCAHKVRLTNTGASAAYVSLNWQTNNNNWTGGTVPMTSVAAGATLEQIIPPFYINDEAYEGLFYQTTGYSMRNPNNVNWKVEIFECRPKLIFNLRDMNIFICSPSYMLSGVYYNLQGCIDWILNHRDTANTPVTVYYLNGLYDLHYVPSRPAAIRKGPNKINLIGESMNGCILQLNSTPAHNNKIMDIGGPCVIENFTMRNILNDDGTTWNGSNNSYCVHNDFAYAASDEYMTVVRNCRLYSEMYCPVGAGLQDKQHMIYDNVIAEFNPQYSGYSNQGALYVHSPAQASAADCKLTINNCDLISDVNLPALALPSVSGSLQYSQIPTTIKRSILTSEGPVETYVSRDNTLITKQSALNNVDALNY